MTGRTLFPEKRLLPIGLNPSDVLYVGDPRLSRPTVTVASWSGISGTPTTIVGYGISDAQPLSNELTAIAGLTSEADTSPYFTGSGTASLAKLKSETSSNLLRKLAGSAYSTLGHAVTDFGADPAGFGTATSSLQAAFDATGASYFSGTCIPPGTFYTGPLTSSIKPSDSSPRTGFIILGSGMANDANTGASVGTMLIMEDGHAGDPILTMDGAAGVRVSDLAFCGSASLSTITGAGSGIVWQNRTGSGVSSGTSTLSRVGFFWCVVGVDIGVTDADHDEFNCDTIGFQHCVWLDSPTAVRLNQNQNVVFSFDMPVIFRSDVAFDLVKGGCVTVNMLSTYNVGIVFKVTEGGVSSSISVHGGHLDSDGTGRSRLYVAAASSSPCIAIFDGVESNPNMLSVVSGGPFVTVKAGHTVILRGMSNMGSANGAIFKIDGGGRVILDGCAIPATLAQVLDATSVLGATGSYAVVNCTDEATGLPIPDYGTAQIATAHIADLAVTNAKLAGSIDLTAKVTGILPIANGGTGKTTGSADGWTTILASADQTTAGDAQNTNHNDFSFAVTAGKYYMVEYQIAITANNATGDAEVAMAVSAGTMTGSGQHMGHTTGGAVGNFLTSASGAAATGNLTCGVIANNQVSAVRGWFVFKCDTNATFNFQFGTNAPSGGTRTATIFKNSWFRYSQVST